MSVLTYEDGLRDCAEQIEKLQADLEAALVTIGNLTDKLLNTEKERDAAMDEKAALEIAHNELKRTIPMRLNEREQLQAENERLRDDLNIEEDKALQYRGSHEVVMEENERLRERIAELEHDAETNEMIETHDIGARPYDGRGKE